jgi:hypothetical protein
LLWNFDVYSEDSINCVDFEKLKEIEKEYENIETFKGFNIIEKLHNPKEIEYSSNKSVAAMNATDVRSEKVKYKKTYIRWRVKVIKRNEIKI